MAWVTNLPNKTPPMRAASSLSIRFRLFVLLMQAFAVMVFAVAAAEVAVGLALIISIYRRRNTVVADDIDLMKW